MVCAPLSGARLVGQHELAVRIAPAVDLGSGRGGHAEHDREEQEAAEHGHSVYRIGNFRSALQSANSGLFSTLLQQARDFLLSSR